MDQKIKEIVAKYVQISPDEITAQTIIDRSKVSSSIVLHRLYAKLAEEGFAVDNYWDIKTFGDILKKNNGDIKLTDEKIRPEIRNIEESNIKFSLGIDIEEISALPLAEDFREHDFYKMNYAPSEISYCILQPDPYSSFAGLFAAKEAIVKADNSYMNQKFNTIVIDHSINGQPKHNDFQLSISHVKNLAISIAFLSNTSMVNKFPDNTQHFVTPRKFGASFWLSIIALVISILSFIVLKYSFNR